MKNKLNHFAIHIDNIERAKQFYQGVFEWGFASYGPPDFLQIKADQSEDSELIGALQSRKYSPVREKIVDLSVLLGSKVLMKLSGKLKKMVEKF